MKQRFLEVHVELINPVNTEDAEKKIRGVFPDNVRRLIVGVDHKNFMWDNEYKQEQKQKSFAEIMLGSNSVPINVKYECNNCGNGWSAKGYRTDDGIYTVQNSEICLSCGNRGVLNSE